MTPITEDIFRACQAETVLIVAEMKKKIIGALVLASLSWWSVPTAFAAFSTSNRARSAPSSAKSKAHDHDCCPGVHPRPDSPLFVAITPPAMPCGDEHPCCAKPTPDNSFSLPAVNRITRPGPETIAVTIADKDAHSRRGINPQSSRTDFSPPYFVRSTVLRV